MTDESRRTYTTSERDGSETVSELARDEFVDEEEDLEDEEVEYSAAGLNARLAVLREELQNANKQLQAMMRSK